jgi:hypothetical protein
MTGIRCYPSSAAIVAWHMAELNASGQLDNFTKTVRLETMRVIQAVR